MCHCRCHLFLRDVPCLHLGSPLLLQNPTRVSSDPKLGMKHPHASVISAYCSFFLTHRNLQLLISQISPPLNFKWFEASAWILFFFVSQEGSITLAPSRCSTNICWINEWMRSEWSTIQNFDAVQNVKALQHLCLTDRGFNTNCPHRMHGKIQPVHQPLPMT